MVTKKELIKKYEGKECLGIAAILRILLYEINFEENFVFGATEMRGGKKAYFLRHLEIDDNGYVYFALHDHKHYRKDFEFFRTPPLPPENYPGKIKE